MIEPKEQANKIVDSYLDADLIFCDPQKGDAIMTVELSKECAKVDINGKLDLLRELNEVKLCQFYKEIEYWEEVLKEVDSL